MNISNLMNQLSKSTNPTQMLMSMLNPNQNNQVNLFQNKNRQAQAEEIANKCNELGITKEQFQAIVGLVNKK